MNSDMLSRRLARRGFTVVIAVDGAEGVAMTRSEQPDLVLMDMSLPVMNGWQATQAIRVVEPLGELVITEQAGEIESKGMARPVAIHRVIGIQT